MKNSKIDQKHSKQRFLAKNDENGLFIEKQAKTGQKGGCTISNTSLIIITQIALKPLQFEAENVSLLLASDHFPTKKWSGLRVSCAIILGIQQDHSTHLHDHH